MNDDDIQQNDQVELLRGGTVVSSFAGAFGGSLRETRLTAILGYLIALKPKVFCDEFGITGTIESVWLEPHDEQGRPDIRIESTNGLAIIEAKVDTTDPFGQANKYDAKWKVLVTQYLPTSNQKNISGVKYRRWSDIAKLIKRNKSQFSKGGERFVSDDLINYLKEHNMIHDPSDEKTDEIYVRDINYWDEINRQKGENRSADSFLKGHIYGCHYEPGSDLPKMRYFAPYFGQLVSASHPGLQEGISHIAKILSVREAATAGEFKSIVEQVKKETRFQGGQDYVNQVKEWFFGKSYWGRKKTIYSFVFLSVPCLAFNPPIKKGFLRKRPGQIGKGYFTFDQFYRAWGGEPIF